MAGLSVRQLARMSGVAHSQIIRIERGDTDPTVSTVERLLAPCRRQLVVSDGTARPSRLANGMLSVDDALARHAAEVVEIAERWECGDVRRISPDMPVLEGEADDVAILLVSRPEPLPTAAQIALTHELEYLLRHAVEVVRDDDADAWIVAARPWALPLRPGAGQGSPENQDSQET